MFIHPISGAPYIIHQTADHMWGSTGCHVTPACLHSGYRQWVSSDLWSSHRQRQSLIAGFSPHTFSHCLSSWPHDALDHAWGVQNLQLKASDCKLLCSFFDCFNSLLHILRRWCVCIGRRGMVNLPWQWYYQLWGFTCNGCCCCYIELVFMDCDLNMHMAFNSTIGSKPSRRAAARLWPIS